MSLKEGKRSLGETDGGLRVTEGHLCRGRHLAFGFCVGVIGTSDFHSVLEIELRVVDRICPNDRRTRIEERPSPAGRLPSPTSQHW